MTGKDYKLLAKALAEAYDSYKPETNNKKEGIDIASYKICDALILDNSRFNRETFLDAVVIYQVRGKM